MRSRGERCEAVEQLGVNLGVLGQILSDGGVASVPPAATIEEHYQAADDEHETNRHPKADHDKDTYTAAKEPALRSPAHEI